MRKKSYVRIEMPLKIEEGQFIHKIAKISIEDLKEYYKELLNILNVDALIKITNNN